MARSSCACSGSISGGADPHADAVTAQQRQAGGAAAESQQDVAPAQGAGVGGGAWHSHILPLPVGNGRERTGRLRQPWVFLAYRCWPVPRSFRGAESVTTQDEELAVTERSRGLPSPQEVIELLDGEFARAGYEIERRQSSTPATQPPRITVVADGDTARTWTPSPSCRATASELLDDLPDSADGYVLEVTSPGVDRPLTAEKHFRRARGRKVELTLSDGAGSPAGSPALDDGVLRLVVRATARAPWSVREIAFDDIAKAVVQVEFSPPSPSELELVGQPAGNAGTEAEHEHRHGRAARDRGGPRHLGRRAARDHQVGAADRLPAHRGPSGRRAHRHRPQDR